MSAEQFANGILDDELFSRLKTYARDLVPAFDDDMSEAEMVNTETLIRDVEFIEVHLGFDWNAPELRPSVEDGEAVRSRKEHGANRAAKSGRSAVAVSVALTVAAGSIGLSVVAIQQAADRPTVTIETTQSRGIVIATRVPKRFRPGVRGLMVGPNPSPPIQRSLQLFGPNGQGVAISIWPSNVDEISLTSSSAYDPVRPFAERPRTSAEFVANNESLTVQTGSGQHINLRHYDVLVRPGIATKSTNRWAGSLRFEPANRNHLVVSANANRETLAQLIRTVRITSGSLSVAEDQLPVGWGAWRTADWQSVSVNKVEYPFGYSEGDGVTVTELSPNTMRFAELSKEKVIQSGSRTIRLLYPNGGYPTAVVASFQGRTVNVTGPLTEEELIEVAKSLRVAHSDEETKLGTRHYIAISDVAVAGELASEGSLPDGNQWRATHSDQFGQSQSSLGKKVDLVVGLSRHPGAIFPLIFLDGRGQVGSQFLSPGSVVFAPAYKKPVRAVISQGAKKIYGYFLPALGEERQVAFFPSIDITRETNLTIETADPKNPTIPGSQIERN